MVMRNGEPDARAAYHAAERLHYVAGRIWSLQTDLCEASVTPFVSGEWTHETIVRIARYGRVLEALTRYLIADKVWSIGGGS